ncbi:hypothetical protein Hypma_006098 [Hypsizygus marmoreus]|uniref:Uncharacterized protein n=1 Tax=Hypsizygus marmoreus TaxID=39966 RepID=A0A369JV14_HYPMA|nr:hypothetical protein Hypma_006098 [Hypsizygus marmoreus]
MSERNTADDRVDVAEMNELRMCWWYGGWWFFTSVLGMVKSLDYLRPMSEIRPDSTMSQMPLTQRQDPGKNGAPSPTCHQLNSFSGGSQGRIMHSIDHKFRRRYRTNTQLDRMRCKVGSVGSIINAVVSLRTSVGQYGSPQWVHVDRHWSVRGGQFTIHGEESAGSARINTANM